jgi:hypothetical protein
MRDIFVPPLELLLLVVCFGSTFVAWGGIINRKTNHFGNNASNGGNFAYRVDNSATIRGLPADGGANESMVALTV